MENPKTVSDLCVEFKIDVKTLAERAGLDEPRVTAIILGRWTPSPSERDPGAAARGSSGHACFGYRARNSFRTCGYVFAQKLARSSVTCCGLPFGASRCSNTRTRPPAMRGVSP